jgi:hypothetical protein
MRIIAALITAVLLGITQPAQADSSFEDLQPCVTEQEVNSLPPASKAAVEQHFDTSGWTVYSEHLFKIKHYLFCGHPWGWVAVSYTLTKRGWKYRAAVSIYECKTRSRNPDGTWGEWEMCDPNLPSDIEWAVLRGHGKHAVRLVRS